MKITFFTILFLLCGVRAFSIIEDAPFIEGAPFLASMLPNGGLASMLPKGGIEDAPFLASPPQEASKPKMELLIMLPKGGSGQASLSGNIVDQFTTSPIEGVEISLIDFRTQTDSLGTFQFFQIPIGKYALQVKKIGYQTKVIDILIEENKTTTLQLELKFTPLSLPDYLVKADRPRSAASSGLLNAVDFELRPKNTAQDVLRAVPGLFIAQHAGGGKAEQIFIRGFDCDHGTDIAGFVDGIPVNMPSHGHGQGYMDLHFLIPETIKSIDIHKGSYFAELGDFATGGAVAFKTLDRLDKNALQLEMGAVATNRGFAHSRALIMYQLPFSKTNISSYLVAENIYSPSYFNLDQQFIRRSLMYKTKIDFSPNQSLSLLMTTFSSSWNASGQIPERAVADGSIDRFGSIDPTEGGSTARENISLTYTHNNNKQRLRITPFLAFLLAPQVEAQIYASHYRFNLFSNFTFFLNDNINGDGINQRDDRTIYGMNLKQSWLGDKQKFTIGGGTRYDHIENGVQHAIAQRVGEGIAHADVRLANANIYLKEEYQISAKLRTELGLRFNYLSFDVHDLIPSDGNYLNYSGKNEQTQLAPKLNFIYTASDAVKLFVNMGRGFHSNDARATVQHPTNKSLPSAWGGELGMQMRLSPKVTIAAAFWGMELDNELVFVGDDGTTADRGSSRRLGIDLGLRAKITNWLSADLDLNLAQNNLTDRPFGELLTTNNLIPLAPTFTSTGGLTFRLPMGIEGSLRYRYLASRAAIETNAVRTRAYNVLDFSCFYGKNKYKIGINIENLVNTEWNEAQFETESRLKSETTSVSELHFTPGTPFSAKLIVRYEF
jgi:outer membrane receptor protein involved in Fe transport